MDDLEIDTSEDPNAGRNQWANYAYTKAMAATFQRDAKTLLEELFKAGLKSSDPDVRELAVRVHALRVTAVALSPKTAEPEREVRRGGR